MNRQITDLENIIAKHAFNKELVPYIYIHTHTPCIYTHTHIYTIYTHTIYIYMSYICTLYTHTYTVYIYICLKYMCCEGFTNGGSKFEIEYHLKTSWLESVKGKD